MDINSAQRRSNLLRILAAAGALSLLIAGCGESSPPPPKPQAAAPAPAAPQRQPPAQSQTQPAPATARLAAGPSDAGCGLWVGPSPSDALVVAVNGDGYTAIYTLSDGAPTFIREWQTFPRIALQGQPNRLRLDLAGGQATVRLNDEFVASFAWAPPPGPLLIGALAETFDTGGASATFEHLRIWQGISR